MKRKGESVPRMTGSNANSEMRATIAETLVAMVRERSYSSISVRELSSRAHVSKSSFYRCFDSKDDALLHYGRVLYACDFESDLRRGVAKPSREEASRFLRKRFDFVRRHASYFRVLESNGLLDRMFASLDADLADLLSGGTASVSPYTRALFVGSSTSIIKCWIQRDFREDEDELVELFSRVAELT